MISPGNISFQSMRDKERPQALKYLQSSQQNAHPWNSGHKVSLFERTPINFENREIMHLMKQFRNGAIPGNSGI